MFARALVFLRLLPMFWACIAHYGAFAETISSTSVRSELLGLLSEKVPEIQRARTIGLAGGCRVGTFGFTSAELNTFISRKIVELGGEEPFSLWLSQQKRISLFEWHHADSPLELIVIPNDTESSKQKPEQISSIAHKIEKALSGGTLYTKASVTNLQEHYANRPADRDYLAPSLSVPISERGVEALPQLQTLMDGERVNLATQGLEEFQRGTLEFREGFPKTTPGIATEENFLQALKWLRISSESGLSMSDKSIQELKRLIPEGLASRPILVKALQEGDSGIENKQERNWGLNEQIIQQLMYLQLHSRNSNRTHDLLEKSGVLGLARQANIHSTRIYSPMPMSAPKSPLANGPEDYIPVTHGTDLLGLQNVRGGAYYLFSSQSRLPGGKAAMGGSVIRNGGVTVSTPAMWVTTESSPSEYGPFRLRYELRSKAMDAGTAIRVNDLHFKTYSQSAFAIGTDGNPKLQPIDRDSILAEAKESLHGHSTSDTSLTAIATVISPDDFPEDRPLFQEAFQAASESDGLEHFLDTYFHGAERFKRFMNREGELARFFDSVFHFSRPLSPSDRKIVASLRDMVGKKLRSNSEHIDRLFEILKRPHEFNRGALMLGWITPHIRLSKNQMSIILDALLATADPLAHEGLLNGLQLAQWDSDTALNEKLLRTALKHLEGTVPSGKWETEIVTALLSQGMPKANAAIVKDTVRLLKRQVGDGNLSEASHLALALSKARGLDSKGQEMTFSAIKGAITATWEKWNRGTNRDDEEIQTLGRLLTAIGQLPMKTERAFQRIEDLLVDLYEKGREWDTDNHIGLPNIRGLVLQTLPRLPRVTPRLEALLLESRHSNRFADVASGIGTRNPLIISELITQLTEGGPNEDKRFKGTDYLFRAKAARALGMIALGLTDRTAIVHALRTSEESDYLAGQSRLGIRELNQAREEALNRILSQEKAEKLNAVLSDSSRQRETHDLAKDLMKETMDTDVSYLHWARSRALAKYSQRHPLECEKTMTRLAARAEAEKREYRERVWLNNQLGY